MENEFTLIICKEMKNFQVKNTTMNISNYIKHDQDTSLFIKQQEEDNLTIEKEQPIIFPKQYNAKTQMNSLKKDNAAVILLAKKELKESNFNDDSAQLAMFKLFEKKMEDLRKEMSLNNEKHSKEIETMNSTITEMKAKNETLNSEFTNMKAKNETLNSEFTNMKAKNETLNSEVTNMKAKNETLNSEITNMKAENETIKHKVDTLNLRINYPLLIRQLQVDVRNKILIEKGLSIMKTDLKESCKIISNMIKEVKKTHSNLESGNFKLEDLEFIFLINDSEYNIIAHPNITFSKKELMEAICMIEKNQKANILLYERFFNEKFTKI